MFAGSGLTSGCRIVPNIDQVEGAGGFVLNFGDANNVNFGYLDVAGNTPSNLSGYVVPFNGFLTAINASTNGPETWIVEVQRNNISTIIASLSITAAESAFDDTFNVPIIEGDEIQIFCNGSGISNPLVSVGISIDF
jgi:hypothetical protein